MADVRIAITTLATANGITGRLAPIDDFVECVANLCDAAVGFDDIELLLVTLARHGIISDKQRFILHAAYLRQKGRGI